MKFLVKKSLILAVLIFWISKVVIAQDLNYTFVEPGNLSFELRIPDPADQMQVRIEDENGYVLHREKIAEEASFGRMFNLVNLPIGKYLLFLEDGKIVHRLPIAISPDKLSILEEDLHKIYKPNIAFDHSHIDMRLRKPNGFPTDVSFIDWNGNELYSETFDTSGVLRKRFNVSRLVRGNYVITIRTEGHTFSEVVTIR